MTIKKKLYLFTKFCNIYFNQEATPVDAHRGCEYASDKRSGHRSCRHWWPVGNQIYPDLPALLSYEPQSKDDLETKNIIIGYYSYWGAISYQRTATWTLETAAGNRDLVLRLNHFQRFLSHKVHFLPGGHVPWIFPCMITWSRSYLLLCIMCPRYWVLGHKTCVEIDGHYQWINAFRAWL